MPSILKPEQQSDLLSRGFSRRSFARIATVLTAGATLPFYDEPALAQASKRFIPPGGVKLDANENPLGPCPEAQEAIRGVIANGGRYMFESSDRLAQTMADQLGVKFGSDPDANNITIFAGSSAPLHQAVLSFCSKERPFVKADPGYEAGETAARYIGAKVVNVPLRKPNYDHDVKAMLAAAPNAGLFYICNPNNPTGTLTSRSDIEYLVANKPQGSVVMIDEAYIHFSPSAVQCTDMVTAGKDVVILRTFSKLYGMAGLRAGAAIARPDLLTRVSQWSAGAMPITSMYAADASLKVKNLVSERRQYMSNARDETLSWLASKNIEFTRSESNCFMINTKRNGKDFAKDMSKENVFVGRAWPVWPEWIRVTVGTPDEMAKFRAAFAKVYNA